MPRKISEERTRKEMVDPQLEQAVWYLRDHAEERAKVKIEIPVDGYDAERWSGVSDYCLYRENGEMLVLSFVEGLAVVEAKKTAVDVRLAETQLTHYVTEIKASIVSSIWFFSQWTDCNRLVKYRSVYYA